MSIPLSVGLLSSFIVLSAFFSGTESAFTSLSPAQIASLRGRKDPRGPLVAELASRPDRLLTTVLIGNNLMNIAASALATQITIRVFGSTAIGLMTGVMTLVMLMFAEVTPKQLAIAFNESICLRTARMIRVLSIIFHPVILLIAGFSRTVARLSGAHGRRSLTLDGILHIVRHAESLGILEAYKSRLVKNLFRFSDISVGAIMTHRTDVSSLERNTSIGDAARSAGETGFARIPVFKDDPEQIVGVVLTKDLIRYLDRADDPVRSIMLEPLFIPEQRRIDQAMTQLLREKLNLAIVLDEFGGVAGIVTLEDIVEEIIGEIYDENESREGTKITRLGPHRFLIRADIPLSVINDFLPDSLETESNDVHTLGGWLVEQLGRIPSPSEVISSPSGDFTVASIEKNRIVQVTYTRRTSD